METVYLTSQNFIVKFGGRSSPCCSKAIGGNHSTICVGASVYGYQDAGIADQPYVGEPMGLIKTGSEAMAVLLLTR